jgi:hypothetical protein
MTINEALRHRYRMLREQAHNLAAMILGDDPRYTSALEALMQQAADDWGLSSYAINDLREACVRADITFWKVAQLRVASKLAHPNPDTLTATNMLSLDSTREAIEAKARYILAKIEGACEP